MGHVPNTCNINIWSWARARAQEEDSPGLHVGAETHSLLLSSAAADRISPGRILVLGAGTRSETQTL